MMKNVLIIDESPLLREYLKTKLLENEGEVAVETAGGSKEAAAKMRIAYPDLILLDYPLGNQTYMEVLQEMKLNPNTDKVPVILLARKIDQQKIIDLLPFGVKKVFTKPLKVDTLFKTISEFLGIKYTIDKSPGIVDVHVNDEILFIELAQGLNNDKLEMLYYKVRELLGLYETQIPRMIIMLSDLNLNEDMGITGISEIKKLEKLLLLLLKASNAKRRILQVLTKDAHIRQFIAGQKNLAEFRVVGTLQEAMDLFYAGEKTAAATAKAPADKAGDDADAEVLHDIADQAASGRTILQADEPRIESALLLRFDKDFKKHLTTEALREAVRNLRIGAVDDDGIILELIRGTFETVGASVKTYSNGADFLKEPDKDKFDLVFMDILMPELDGFTILRQLQGIHYQTPVIVMSALNKQEMVIKAFQMGVKSYLFKPLNPDEVFNKTLEVLKPNF
jgi:CheY-like chemotaxis protein